MSNIYDENADRWQAHARNTRLPPAPQANTRTRVRGERLSPPLYWRGSQWAVTGFGVECRDGCYCIRKDRIWDTRRDGSDDWILHMLEKRWVDMDDFAEALRVARMRWPQRPR